MMCVLCGISILGSDNICSHHYNCWESGWAESNRVFCDFIHRHKQPPPNDVKIEDAEAIAEPTGVAY